jgi:hypothetical protein
MRACLSTLRRFRLGLPALLLVAILFTPSIASAQGKKGAKNTEEVAERSYTLPYVVTIMFLGLGVTVACMPAQRESGNLDRDLA